MVGEDRPEAGLVEEPCAEWLRPLEAVDAVADLRLEPVAGDIRPEQGDPRLPEPGLPPDRRRRVPARRIRLADHHAAGRDVRSRRRDERRPIVGCVHEMAREEDRVEAAAQTRGSGVRHHAHNARRQGGDHTAAVIDPGHRVAEVREGSGDPARTASEVEHARSRRHQPVNQLRLAGRREPAVEGDGAAVRGDVGHRRIVPSRRRRLEVPRGPTDQDRGSSRRTVSGSLPWSTPL
jgi:hypothetical protein